MWGRVGRSRDERGRDVCSLRYSKVTVCSGNLSIAENWIKKSVSSVVICGSGGTEKGTKERQTHTQGMEEERTGERKRGGGNGRDDLRGK